MLLYKIESTNQIPYLSVFKHRKRLLLCRWYITLHKGKSLLNRFKIALNRICYFLLFVLCY